MDTRLGTAKHVSTPWALRRYRTLAEWGQRTAAIRRHILVCAGLWPLPEKTPLKAQVFGRIEREGYAVEKVFFESLPGFFVCGNLYRPLGEGPFPALACPHGHWRRGRLENTELGSIAGRCINFARQGMVAFSYDMVGYNNSDQFVHREIGGRREALWGIGALSLQLWNSIRVVDFLASLADVDAERIGCTGASGGGTQTFLLMAVDERIKAAAPVNMVSAFMQGGCRCENQGHLRLDINNVEIASCMAPRPLLMVSCTGDWTANTPEVEFPAVRAIYGLYGAQNKVSEVQIDAPHNYNQPSREAVYAFFKRHLLGGRGKVAEQPFTVEEDEDLLVFSGRKKPAHALDAQGVFDAVIARSEKRLAARLASVRIHRFQWETRPALASLLGVDATPQVAVESLGFRREEGYVAEDLVLGRVGCGERVRAMCFLPRGPQGKVPATLIADANWGGDEPGALAQGLLQAGGAVLIVAPFLTDGTEREGHDEMDPLYHTYNQATMACRVQDILTGLAYLDQHLRVGKRHLVGQGEAGIWCLFARALASGVGSTAVDWGGRDLGDDEAWSGALFVPGIRALGDVRTALALCAPGRLLVHGAGDHFSERVARRCYRAAGKGTQLVVEAEGMSEDAIIEWIN
ncbi:MAG: acetylxylan esterase [Gemmatimonadetes bacterium]|nr:acetylxylan esterase [Gemmatimonadota bacterium]